MNFKSPCQHDSHNECCIVNLLAGKTRQQPKGKQMKQLMINTVLRSVSTVVTTLMAGSAMAWGTSFYGANGAYAGRFQSNGFGGGSFYGANGAYAGRIQSNGFGGGSFYGANGAYMGSWRGAEGKSNLFNDDAFSAKIDVQAIIAALTSRDVDALTSCAWDLKGLETVLGRVDKKTSSKMLFAAAAQLAVEQGNAKGLKAIVALEPECKKYEDQLALKGKTRGAVSGFACCLPEIVPLETQDWKDKLKGLKDWQVPMFNRDMVCCNFRGVSEGDAEACAAMINGGRATMNPLMEAVGAVQLSKYAAVDDISAKFQPSSIFKEATEMAIYKGDSASLKQLVSLYETSSFLEPDYLKYIKSMAELSGKTRGLTDEEVENSCKKALLVLIGGLIAGALN